MDEKLIKNYIIYRRFYRRYRSKLKKRLRLGGNVPSHLKSKYNLHPKEINQFFNIPKPLTKPKEYLSIKIPNVFSITRNHNETMLFLAETQKKLDTRKFKNVFIDHSNVKFIGLSASYLFDIIEEHYEKTAIENGVSVEIAGKTGDNKHVNNFLVAFGLLSGSELDEIPEGFVDHDYKNKYFTFKNSGSKKKPHQQTTNSTDLANYFSQCFRHNKYHLSDEVSKWLAEAFGEMIGNAEEHAIENDDDIVEWHVFGCYNKDTNYCRFSIINSGKTIFENLSNENSTASETIRNTINKIKSTHKQSIKKIFSGESQEPLWNVMALQDGISSKRTISGPSSTRGQGLMDVIEKISELKAPNDTVEISLISGRSKILIDFTYPIQRIIVKGEERRRISFNDEGRLHQLQDESKVICMQEGFQGTIITGRFKINEEYLKRTDKQINYEENNIR